MKNIKPKPFSRNADKGGWSRTEAYCYLLIKIPRLPKTDQKQAVRTCLKLIESRSSDIKKKGQNDFKRFISPTNITNDGEIADKVIYRLDEEAIAREEMYDGFYAICTNLDDDASAITKINHRRWEIEECFRVMKSEFKARPVYLSRDDSIQAHFTTCFLALTLYKIGRAHV